MILSFHPLISADKNILCAGRNPGNHDLEAIKQADAVILPIGCKKNLYDLVRKNCWYVFPNYDMRFDFPGKLGQIELFRKMGGNHPHTETFVDLKSFELQFINSEKKLPMNFPFVFKFDWGGEGENVFLIHTTSDFSSLMEMAQRFENTGQKGFLIQEWIPADLKSLRTVVIGERLISYWRIQQQRNQFKTGLSSGAVIDYQSHPELIKNAEYDLRLFLKKTKINLAGFDFLFSPLSPKPYFIEINYFFGRKGLGGSEKFYKILIKEINQWLNSSGFSHCLELDTH
jgi:ribosomal protein S6--L-glutamate ligase